MTLDEDEDQERAEWAREIVGFLEDRMRQSARIMAVALPEQDPSTLAVRWVNLACEAAMEAYARNAEPCVCGKCVPAVFTAVIEKAVFIAQTTWPQAKIALRPVDLPGASVAWSVSKVTDESAGPTDEVPPVTISPLSPRTPSIPS